MVPPNVPFREKVGSSNDGSTSPANEMFCQMPNADARALSVWELVDCGPVPNRPVKGPRPRGFCAKANCESPIENNAATATSRIHGALKTSSNLMCLKEQGQCRRA